MPPRPAGVRERLTAGAVAGNPRSELRDPQATEARSFVWGKGPCGSAKPVVARASVGGWGLAPEVE